MSVIKQLIKLVSMQKLLLKGLGEISPHEFKSFIHEDGIRLSSVKINNDASIEEIINFYMGKNTPTRREYIMNHLVIDSENDVEQSNVQK